MFKIGDFSRLAQVSVRMLRHYDKLGLLEPSYTDRFTGYRYYTIDQLPRLNRIVALNDLGLTLAQISDLLGKDDKLPAEQLRGMLALRRAELARELEEKRWQLASVEARLQQIETENDPEPYEIVVKSLDAVPVASLRHLAPSVHEVGYFCETLYGQLYQRLGGSAWRGVIPKCRSTITRNTASGTSTWRWPCRLRRARCCAAPRGPSLLSDDRGQRAGRRPHL